MNRQHYLQKIEAAMQSGDYSGATSLANEIRAPEELRYSVLATISQKQGHLQEAEVLFQKALAIKPDHDVSLANISKLLVSQGKFKRALEFAKQAYEKNPKLEHLAMTYIHCLADQDRYAEALAVLKPFVELESPTHTALLAYASLMRANLKPFEALEILERTIRLYPDKPEIQRAVADSYAEVDPEIASQKFHEASKTNDSLALQWNWSFVELRRQNFELGWKLYEAGLSSKVGKIGRPLPAQIRPIRLVTSREELDPAKWTVFSSEQGIGDQVLFFGCLREAIADHPKSILLVEERMVPIVQRSFPEIGVYPYAFGINLIKQEKLTNGVFPIGSLQRYYRRNPQDYAKARHPYLRPNERLVSKYRSIFDKSFHSQKLIGISWRGGFWDRQKRTKSLDFEIFSKFLDSPNTRYVSLQYGDIAQEKKFAEENRLPITFIDGIDFVKDIDAWIALGSLCDSILSVSTALVHFMGAINKPVHLLLGERQAPFIWGTGEGISAPYPSVQIHRQRVGASVEDFVLQTKELIHESI